MPVAASEGTRPTPGRWWNLTNRSVQLWESCEGQDETTMEHGFWKWDLCSVITNTNTETLSHCYYHVTEYHTMLIKRRHTIIKKIFLYLSIILNNSSMNNTIKNTPLSTLSQWRSVTHNASFLGCFCLKKFSWLGVNSDIDKVFDRWDAVGVGKDGSVKNQLLLTISLLLHLPGALLLPSQHGHALLALLPAHPPTSPPEMWFQEIWKVSLSNSVTADPKYCKVMSQRKRKF